MTFTNAAIAVCTAAPLLGWALATLLIYATVRKPLEYPFRFQPTPYRHARQRASRHSRSAFWRASRLLNERGPDPDVEDDQ